MEEGRGGGRRRESGERSRRKGKGRYERREKRQTSVSSRGSATYICTELSRPFICIMTSVSTGTYLLKELCKFLDSLLLVRVIAGQGHVFDTVL